MMVAMESGTCHQLLLTCIGIVSLQITGSRAGESSPDVPPAESRTHFHSNKGWHTFGLKEYKFILDSGHRLDLTRAHAKHNCQHTHNADLASFDTEDELQFVKNEIGNQVRSLGLRLMTEQWWTNGISYRQHTWVWDTEWKPQVNVSALRRSTVPRPQGPHFLALTHLANSRGWRLMVTPGNYKLRYICQRNRTFGIKPSTPNTPQDEKHLLKQLLDNYDATEPPPILGNRQQIQLEIQLLPVQDNVTNTILHVKQEIITRWQDPRLSWQPIAHGGIGQLPAASHKVWFPDVYSPRDTPHRFTCQVMTSQTVVTIAAAGEVTLRRTCDVMYNCSLQKPAAFPFDHQHCRTLVVVDSGGAAITVSRAENGAPDSSFQQAWTVSSLTGGVVEAYQTDSTTVASAVQLTLYLHRNVMYHILTLLVPCVFLSLVLLILLWLPHGSGLKCVATFLVTVTFLLYLGLGGRFRQNHRVSYSDMFMVVMSIIGLAALITQICILRLTRRHQKRLPPPPWIQRVVTNRSHEAVGKSACLGQKQKESRSAKKSQKVCANKNLQYAKWLEEKELMLEDQPLGMTSLGSDARKQSHYSSHSPDCDGYKNTQIVINSRTNSLNNRDQVHHQQYPNGTTKRHIPPPPPSVGVKYLNPGKYKETALYTKTKDSDKCSEENRELGDISAGESFDSGCHSVATKNSPDVTAATPESVKECQWKRYIVWCDRAVSLVISAAVIFSIMVFTVIFLAT